MKLPDSKVTRSQKKTFGPKRIDYYGKPHSMSVFIRYDDNCGNGHNTFSVTAEIRRLIGSVPGRIESCGCLHDEIKQFFPELTHLIKWHLVSSDGPMHYIANTVYHVKQGNLEFARQSAVWPEAKDEQLVSEFLEHDLNERLPALMGEFKAVIESLGFTY